MRFRATILLLSCCLISTQVSVLCAQYSTQGRVPSPAKRAANRYTLNGYVSDAETGERLIGATVYDTISRQGVVTNNAGFYSLPLTADSVAVQVSYVGYNASRVRCIVLRSDSLVNISLRSSARLEEVTVVAHQSLSGPNSVQMSAVEVPIEQIKTIPALAGEVDVLKAIQLLPGVQSGSEGSAGVYVRGGGPDENLILLDGVPLYNVNHAMGMFSVFNADAVKNVTLYKGNFPARFGSRLSSVIDVRQNDGNTDMWHGNLSVGLISAKLNFEGPIFTSDQLYSRHKGDTCHAATTFQISARRTYYDAFFAPLMATVVAAESSGNMSALAGYYFYDVNAKVSHTFSNNDRLSASFYMGDDVIYVRYGEKDTYMTDTEENNMQLRWNWGNIVAAVQHQHRYGSRMFSNTQLSFTRYGYNLTESAAVKRKENDVDFSFDQSMSYKSLLMDVTLRSDFEYQPVLRHTLRFGAEYDYHQFMPTVGSVYVAAFGPNYTMNQDTSFTDGRLHGHEVALYIEDNYKPFAWLDFNFGLRTSLYTIDGKVYPSAEPRIGLRALMYKGQAFKASYSYMSQYIHLLSSSSVSTPTDLWVPVTANIPPMRSMQVAAGLSYDILGQVEISVEGYYKKSLNLIEYKEGATFFGSATGWQDKVAIGDGWSYGVEVLLKRTRGPVTGWIGYTWNRSMRLFDREGMVINNSKPFHAKYDREHDLSVTLQYQITKLTDVCATFVYGSGNRGTLTTQSYYDGVRNTRLEIIPERNNYTMPDYHRLDLAANFHIPHRKSGVESQKSKDDWLKNAEHIVNVSVYNVYCHKNPYLVFMMGNQLKQISIFPILPSVSYTFKF